MLKKKFVKSKEEYEVTFETVVPDAEEVALVCEHNNWEPIPMKRVKKSDSTFRTQLRLPQQERQYQFRYLIDKETWINDDEADTYQPNEYGSENSVVAIVGKS